MLTFLAFLIFLSLFVISLWDGVNVFGAPIVGDLLTTGTPLSIPPLIDLISNDPILRGVKVFLLTLFCYIVAKVYSSRENTVPF